MREKEERKKSKKGKNIQATKKRRREAAKRSIKLRLLCIFSALSHNLYGADGGRGGKIATKATYFRLNSHKFALRRCFMPQTGPPPLPPLSHSVCLCALPCPLAFGMPHLADLISQELFRFAFVLLAFCVLFLFTVKFNATCFAFAHSSHHIAHSALHFDLHFALTPRPRQHENHLHKTSHRPQKVCNLFSNHLLNSNYSLCGRLSVAVCVFVLVCVFSIVSKPLIIEPCPEGVYNCYRFATPTAHATSCVN